MVVGLEASTGLKAVETWEGEMEPPTASHFHRISEPPWHAGSTQSAHIFAAGMSARLPSGGRHAPGVTWKWGLGHRATGRKVKG